eukprot:TRINITY_DN9506_c0_g1_i11.p1 TRINITY_DN9506_c0_g1~~TRINITY_DN9506_c0_g1_i11.p1  ORF type:complete len:158 (+),score=38.53 TRINITY_DN9506_c0_g1_i11:171-644(+)
MVESKDEREIDFFFKIILIGSHFVGKTQLINRYIKNSFDINSVMTIGIECLPKRVTIQNKVVVANIWDTIGEEKFKSITALYYKGAVGAILVYDITRRESFTEICRQWFDELKNNCETDLVTMLIGNKCDLANERQVKTEEAVKFAKKHGMALSECL